LGDGTEQARTRRPAEWSFYLQEGTTVQTLVLDKERFSTRGSASKWVRDHNFKTSKVDEKAGTFRYRQREPSEFKRGSFRTIQIADGVQAVIGRLGQVEASQQGLFHQTISYLGEVGTISLSDDAGACSWVQVFTLGAFRHPQGEFHVDDAFLGSIVNSFEDMKGRGAEIPVDYEHGSSLPGATPEAARAAGWVTDVDHRPGSGLWAKVQWTDDAVDFISSREYRFISPEFHPDYVDEVGNKLGPTLLAVGLVNRPHLKGMEAVSLKESRTMSDANAPVAPDSEPVTAAVKREIVEYDTTAVTAQEADLHDLIKQAFDRLDNLAARIDAFTGDGAVESEEQEDMMSYSETPKPEPIGDPPSSPSVPQEVTTLMAEMNDRLQRVEAENTALRAERDAVAAKADIDMAFREGRITRAQVEPLMSLRLKDQGAFEAILMATPKGSVAGGETEHGVYGDQPNEHDVDLISVIKAKASEEGVSFAKAYRTVTKSQPELVAAYTRKTRDTNGHVGRIIGGQ
jgi:phage I-like protein